MKIIQLIPELNEGGVERGVVELNRELVKRGFESIIISSGGKLVTQIESDGGKYINFDVSSKNPFTLPIRIYKLKKVFKILNPNIIHARSRVPAWISYFAKEKTPFITTVHGFNSVNFYSKIMTKGDRVICVSNSIKEYIQKNYKTPSKKIKVIYRGVDLEKFNIDNLDKEFIENFKIKYLLKDNIILTSVGRVTQLKDFETFIKAVELIKRDFNNIKALIVGGVRDDKREYFIKLQTLVKNLNLKDNIIFTGSQNKIAEIYHLSDIVISSSKKPESFGRAVAEAIAINTPVIASNHGGVKDIIKDGINGFFYKVSDEKDLAQKILLIKNLKNKKFKSYIEKNFNLKEMVDATIKVYKGVSID